MTLATRRIPWLIALALLAACGGGTGSPDDDADVEADAPADETGGDSDVPPDGDDGEAEVSLTCGDGIRDPGEECDRGAENSDTEADACRTDCRAARCGDGVVDSREACDDGNTVDDDGCTNACRAGTCGDGEVQGDEECDDGNEVDTDACLSTCLAARCGDGVIWELNEECDGADSEPCTAACGSAGYRGCVDCRLSADCVPPEETCNGTDDDCDGSADQIFPCVRGEALACTTVCGSTGSGLCTEACAPPGPTACVPPAEVCNGTDDDCDGAPDQLFACAAGSSVACTTGCGTPGTGVCAADCTVPAGADCLGPAETCNGLDDDCDGVCDDGFACCRGTPVACTTACGSAGTAACAADCSLPGPTACVPPAEACNGTDDDCDGACDDGFACCRGLTQTCTSGTCSGTQTCDAGCAWGACNFGAPPANDTCAGLAPITIPGTIGTYAYTGSTCAAANDWNYACGGVTAASADVVYRLVLTESRTVTLDTVGSSFDAMLFLRSGNACPGSELACDDNGAGGTPGQARITRVLAPGTYWIVLDGAGAGNRGTFVLNAAVAAGPVGPINDLCSAAVSLSLTSTLQSVTGTTVGAASDHADCTGGGSAPDVWYVFRLTESSAVFLSLQDGTAAWDSVLAVRSGSCTGPLVANGCQDDACGNQRPLFTGILAAGTYYVAVDGWATASGPFTLYYQASNCTAAADANPSTPTIDPILAAGTYSGSTIGRGDDSRGTCAPPASGTAIPDVYYVLGLCPGRSATLNTCAGGTNFDTVVYVRRGDCRGSAGSPDTCADDSGACSTFPPGPGASSLTFGSAGQGLYYVWVDGAQKPATILPFEGTYALTVGGM